MATAKKTAADKHAAEATALKAEAALAEQAQEEEAAAEPEPLLATLRKKADDEAEWLEKRFPDGGGGPAAERLRDLIGFLQSQAEG